jgi:hypothetical protein
MDLEPDQKRAMLRASDADREETVELLRLHHSDGRLTIDEFTERMEKAYVAKTYGDLSVLTADLPLQIPPTPTVLDHKPPKPAPPTNHRHNFRQHLLAYTWVNGFMISLWALASVISGHVLFFWPIWTILGWGAALGSHALRAFGSPSPEGGHDLAYRRRQQRYDRWSARERRRRRRYYRYYR